MRISKLLAGVALATLVGGAAQAAVTEINGNEFTDGLNNQVIGGLTWTSTRTPPPLPALPAAANFVQKSLGGFTGVGITNGRTGDEIDLDETLAASAATAFAVNSITIGVLFNGDEFGDVLEKAQISVNLGGTVFTLTTTLDDNVATLADAPAGASVEKLSPAVAGSGAVWKIKFDPLLSPVTSIAFTALEGACGTACSNQSDFTLVQMVISPVGVPEPATLALFGAGLLGMGLAARRRRKA